MLSSHANTSHCTGNEGRRFRPTAICKERERGRESTVIAVIINTIYAVQHPPTTPPPVRGRRSKESAGYVEEETEMRGEL